MISLKTQPDGSPQTRKQAVAEPSSSRVVPKPVPTSQTKDPRQYQIDQLRKRYSPKESNIPNGGTSFAFKLVPSDPDFPFELAHLDCDLRVPADYPEERPVLRVKNTDIPKGFSINIERGWDRLADEKRGATLLALTRWLDKFLEEFLTEQKVETVKLVAFKDTRHLDTLAVEKPAEKVAPAPVESAKSVQLPAPAPVFNYVPERSFTKDEIAEAKARRSKEVFQLESRMKREIAYRRSPDGIVYTLPMNPRRRSDLPPGLQGLQTIHLIIPMLYPLQDLRVQLNEASAVDAEPVENLFTEKVKERSEFTIMSHLNYLSQSLPRLAKEVERLRPKMAAPEVSTEQQTQQEADIEPATLPTGEKSHVQVIPRPPEWSLIQGEDDSSDDSDINGEDVGGAALGASEEDEEVEKPEASSTPTDNPERGTMMSFPSIELHGIELLEVAILSISVKCERCKTINEAENLKASSPKPLSCKKCATPFSITYRPQLVHDHSTRAGFLDLVGCKVADMLPSTFIPTCSGCSTPGGGLLSVRGETTTNICRECHRKFNFKIPEVKFLLITAGTLPPAPTGPRRKQEKLGLHAGEPLPNKGACKHYRKSYRWFRFSCCSKVHACDQCHDDAESHINEWANRMICGWCSREQNYAVEACGFCGRSVIGRKGKGFWEGGKGTRDQRKMSRKDPRKHKRIGGSQAAKKD